MPTPKGFVLLKENRFDSTAFFRTLQHEWDIVPDDGYMQEGERISFNIRNNICAISLMPAPVPNREAEACAELNYFWPEAAATTRQHRAHLAVVVMPVGYSSSDIDCMSLYSKIISSCLADANALAVYTANTVFAPSFYRLQYDVMRQGELPIPIWAFIGLYEGKGGNCAYSIGMQQFGKLEMEICNSASAPRDILLTLLHICGGVIQEDLTLEGSSVLALADDRFFIERSPSVNCLGEDSLKVVY